MENPTTETLSSPKRVQEPDEIAKEMRARVALRIVGRICQAVSALIVDNDTVAIAECAHLMQPHAFTAGKAVQQNNRRAFAKAAIVDSDIANRDAGHQSAVPSDPKCAKRIH